MAREKTKHMFRAENGPFNGGPDTVYVRAVCKDDAKLAANRVDDFTASIDGIEQINDDEVPDDADVIDVDIGGRPAED